MFGLFRSKKPLIDAGTLKHHEEYFEKLRTALNTEYGEILLPTAEYFPEQGDKKQYALAKYYLEVIKQRYGIKKKIELDMDNSLDTLSVGKKMPIINTNSQ